MLPDRESSFTITPAKMGSMDRNIEAWLDYLAKRNRAEETIRSYRATMERYEAIVGDPIDATIDDVDVWWATLDESSVKTRQRMLSTVRSFYAWAIRWDLLDKAPTRRLDAPTQGRRLARPIGRADLHHLLDEAPPDLRRAYCLGAYAGLRVSEVAALDWSDIDLERNRIRVRGKGDKEREVGLPPLLLDELLPATGGNVVTGGQKAVTGAALQRRINRHIAACGVDGTFHNLRARFVTVALGNGMPLLSVSRAVGHASPATTAIYALSADSDLDLIAEAVTR